MANEYGTLAELKTMRNITGTSQDTALQKALTRASRAIDRRCGRRFYRDEEVSARTISPFGRTIRRGLSEVLLVPDIATSTTVVVTVGGVTSSVSFEQSLDGEPSPVTGLVLSSWYGGDISVTAEWGWPEVPESIGEATLLLANRRYMRKDSPEGTSGWSAEGPVGVSRFDSDIEDLVSPYVIEGFGA